MENIKQNRDVKRFIILISFGLIMTLAIGCGQSSSFGTTSATPTPTPPANYFPATFAELKLSGAPLYSAVSSEYCGCQNFEAIYINGNIAGKYQIELYKSPEEAWQGFNAKKYLEPTSEIIKQNGTEIVSITKIDGRVIVAHLAGANLVIVRGRKDAVVTIENNLPYQELGIAKLPERKIEEFLETPVLASVVQKEFETNQAEAQRKYGANFVLLKGKVADYGDEIETKIVTQNVKVSPTPSSSSNSSRRSGSKLTSIRRTISRISNSLEKTPTPKTTTTTKTTETHHPFVVFKLPVKGGELAEIWCYFDSLQVDKVMKLKPEQEILFRGKITFVEGKIEISSARIEDTKYEGVK